MHHQLAPEPMLLWRCSSISHCPCPFSVEDYLKVDGKSSMYCTRKGPVQPDHPQNGGQGAAGAYLGPRLISQCQIFCSLASFPSQSVGSGDTCLPGIHRGRSHTVLEEYCCQLGSPSPSVKALRQTFYSLACPWAQGCPTPWAVRDQCLWLVTPSLFQLSPRSVHRAPLSPVWLQQHF